MIYFFAYILMVILANLTASNIIDVNGFQFAMGTLFFGGIFTCRDYIHDTLGRKYAYTAIGCAVILSLCLSLIGYVPIRIIIASITALALSEIADTEVYQRLLNRSWFLRILSSNIVSIPLDTVLFTIMAFYGIWDTGLLIAVILGDIVIKFVIATALMGVRAWKYT